jgi:predicted enzyme related to lactoylglutathione lyase
VCWNELASRDAAVASRFYGALFGWSYEDNQHSPVPYHIVRSATGEQMGGIMQMTDEWGDMPSHWTIYLQVDGVDAVAVSVQQMHGRLVCPPFDTPVGRIAILADNQGAAFNVIRLEPGA